MLQIMLIAVTYFLFSNEFFKFSAEIKKEKISLRAHFICFLTVYLWFMAASYLELPLVVNWFIFLIILGIEVHFVLSFDMLVSYGLALFCVITGLAFNVFFRSLASILFKMPLNMFDNVKVSMKSYPIFLGFVTMALLLYGLRRVHFASQLERMLHYKKSLIFYTWTEIFIYLFLMVQLLAYTQSGNNTGIKTWGIKASLFSILVLVVTIIYAQRVASLHYYIEKQHENRNQLIQEKEDINSLWKLAYTDMLTGFNNRQLLEKRLEEYAGYGSHVTLGFIDVNGLKTTNDQYGHVEGDRYLICVARILNQLCDGLNIDLFRYGGDEFVIMSNTTGERDMTQLLARVNTLLENEASLSPRSISYGVASGDCTAYRELISTADDRMYQYKLQYHKHMARA